MASASAGDLGTPGTRAHRPGPPSPAGPRRGRQGWSPTAWLQRAGPGLGSVSCLPGDGKKEGRGGRGRVARSLTLRRKAHPKLPLKKPVSHTHHGPHTLYKSPSPAPLDAGTTSCRAGLETNKNQLAKESGANPCKVQRFQRRAQISQEPAT